MSINNRLMRISELSSTECYDVGCYCFQPTFYRLIRHRRASQKRAHVVVRSERDSERSAAGERRATRSQNILLALCVVFILTFRTTF